MAFFARGTMKPPLGALVNPAHPFVKDHLFTVPFNGPSVDFIRSSPVIWGGIKPRAIAISGTPSQLSNREGPCLTFTTTAQNVDLGADFIGTTAVTIAFVRRKTDTTNRAATVFQVGANGVTAEYVNVFCPYSDDKVYWDFGGASGANRITVTGLTFSAAIPERWVFTAGPQGSSVWQNGVKVGSQSTAVTRTVGTSTTYINSSNLAAVNGDQQDMNFLHVVNGQWSDDMCRWWSAEPYAHLYPATSARKYFDLGGGAVLGGSSGRLTSLGVG